MRSILAALILASLEPAQADDLVSVEVFTDNSLYPLANAQGTLVYDLSAPDRLNLGPGLPQNRQAAAAMAQARASANIEAIRSAYAGHGKATQYRIAKIPAIVFNHGEAVIYGQTDVGLATGFYNRWRASR